MVNIFASRAISEFNFSDLRLMQYMKIKKYTTYPFLTGAHSAWYWLTNLYRHDTDFFFESKDALGMGQDDDFVTTNKFMQTELKQPFFAYMHLMSVHLMGMKHAAFRKYLPDKIDIGVDKKTALVNNYQNGIVQADATLRAIFEKLKNAGELANTTIVICSDHGELFGDDGRWGHGGSLHPALQDIVLMIYDEDPGWYQNTYSATLLDIAPTIADRLGYPVPQCWSGRSLHQPLANFDVELESTDRSEFPYGMVTNRDSVLTMYLMDEHKKIRRTFSVDRNFGQWIENRSNVK